MVMIYQALVMVVAFVLPFGAWLVPALVIGTIAFETLILPPDIVNALYLLAIVVCEFLAGWVTAVLALRFGMSWVPGSVGGTALICVPLFLGVSSWNAGSIAYAVGSVIRDVLPFVLAYALGYLTARYRALPRVEPAAI